uniref:Uncharacterized protein n=2 Tax=Neisseria meningitidis TaxID=487 RepID=I4E396_NEIME|nr:hypothetical protein predicted by Glimmer/Critica [Neisseria meningitidis alpha153]CCA43810.1 hypothetical protein NMALPHA522_0269 [Neisseria meningitidis alpha522]
MLSLLIKNMVSSSLKILVTQTIKLNQLIHIRTNPRCRNFE